MSAVRSFVHADSHSAVGKPNGEVKMERALLLVLFVLSVILAFCMLHDAQSLTVSEATAAQFRNLTVFGYLMAAMALVSGVGLALKIRS